MDHHSLKGFTKEKFRILCAIERVSIVLEHITSFNIQDIQVLDSQEGFKLVLGEPSGRPLISGTSQPLPDDADRGIARELEIFYKVFHQRLTVIFP